MPGGGFIGGGSCNLEFEVKNNSGQTVSKANTEDTAIARGQPVEVTVTFPGGTTTTTILRSKKDKIKYDWKKH